MKKQENCQKLSEMEAATAAASEEIKARREEMDAQGSSKMK